MTRSKWLLVLSIAPAVIASVAGVKIEGIVSSLVGGWALICWVLAFILRKKKNAPGGANRLQSSTQNAPAAARPAPRAADPRPIVKPTPRPEAPQPAAAPAYQFVDFHVAGTSFNNDDGTQRQVILRHIKFKDAPYVTDPEHLNLQIVGYEYEGEPAYKCLVNGYQIGNVPANKVADVAEALKHDDVTISDFDVIGGGMRNGERMSYGASMALRYTPALH